MGGLIWDPVKKSGFTGAVGGLFLSQFPINKSFFIDTKLLELLSGKKRFVLAHCCNDGFGRLLVFFLLKFLLECCDDTKNEENNVYILNPLEAT